jgi:hypothetical protein
MLASDPEDALVPLFAESSNSNALSHVGTGILVDFHTKPFLFTAAHVTDNLQHANLCVPTNVGIGPIVGYVGNVDLDPGQERESDFIDIAYYRLDDDFARSMLSFFKPWPQSRCHLISDSLSLGVCSVYGYPASRFERRGNRYSNESASCRGVAGAEEDYESVSLSADSNIIVRFHKKRSISYSTRKRSNPLHPRGMSGGGIFSWPPGSELSDDGSLPFLVGIFHTYIESKGLMIGTPLISILAAIQVGEMKGFGGFA